MDNIKIIYKILKRNVFMVAARNGDLKMWIRVSRGGKVI